MLIVPSAPLSATGLATPYRQLGCVQATFPSFVQGAILDSVLGTIVVYNPLVIDNGTLPGAAPTPIQVNAIPPGAQIAVWFGTNGDTLTLLDNGQGSLAAGQCVNGVVDPFTNTLSIFGQFAHCGAIAWFSVALGLLNAGVIKPPPLGLAIDGAPCPTTHDFFIVDQDPSDNVDTVYLVTATGLIAQNTTANIALFNPTIFLTNGSDERLIVAVDNAIGCSAWKALDLADAGINNIPALPLNELHATKWQQAPIALVPLGDPMTKLQNQPSLTKTNAYRLGVGQPTAANIAAAPIVDFCFGLYLTFPIRMTRLTGALLNSPSPDPNAADSLYTFLGQRFLATFGANNLDCFDKLGIPTTQNPVRVTFNPNNGLAVGVIITPPNNGPNNPFYAATTMGTIPAVTAPVTSTNTIIAIAVGCGVGALVIVGFIIAFRAHKVRNFCGGVRDGIATKMRS